MAPRITVALANVSPGPTRGSWRIGWRIGNAGRVPITVTEAWHPHERFRSARRRRRSMRIPPDASGVLEMSVRTDLRAGEVMENCFLILRVTSARRAWRILARSTLRVDRDGMPRPAVKAIDVHPARR